MTEQTSGWVVYLTDNSTSVVKPPHYLSSGEAGVSISYVDDEDAVEMVVLHPWWTVRKVEEVR